jgi:hypothetical protein
LLSLICFTVEILYFLSIFSLGLSKLCLYTVLLARQVPDSSLEYFKEVTAVIVHCELGSFRAEIADATLKFGFRAGVPEVCPHLVDAKAIRITAVQHAQVRRSRIVCEMGSCIKIPKSPVAANPPTLQVGCFQVAVGSSGDLYTLKVLSARGACWTSDKPVVNTLFAHKFFALAALSGLPNDICAN